MRPLRTVRFGAFTVDLRSGELYKQGRKIKLQQRPFQILAVLLDRPGEVVTREELRQQIWPPDIFVDFDHSLKTAISKIREALGDSADRPRYEGDVAGRIGEKDYDYEAHGEGKYAVEARRGAYAAQVQRGKDKREGSRPCSIGNLRKDIARRGAAPDDADERIQKIVQEHGPSDYVAERGIELASNVRVGRTGAGIDAGHASIADRGKQHRNHGDEDRGHYMAVRFFADDAEAGHGGCRLHHDDAVNDQVPESKCPSQPAFL